MLAQLIFKLPEMLLTMPQRGQVKVLLVPALDQLVQLVPNITLVPEEVALPWMGVPSINEGKSAALAVSCALILALSFTGMNSLAHVSIAPIERMTIPV
jgi:hypothetical protein